MGKQVTFNKSSSASYDASERACNGTGLNINTSSEEPNTNVNHSTSTNGFTNIRNGVNASSSESCNSDSSSSSSTSCNGSPTSAKYSSGSSVSSDTPVPSELLDDLINRLGVGPWTVLYFSIATLGEYVSRIDAKL